MIAIIVIALAAGAASALMFASIASGALMSLLLIYFAPLPLMVAALGWGPLTAAIGGIMAATGLGLFFGLPFCIAFAVMTALPAWWLGHLALLGRAISGSGDGVMPAATAMDWYPVGRVLLWIGGIAALIMTATLLTLGTDAATITETLREELLRFLGPRAATSGDETRQRIDAMVMIAPATVTNSIMLMLTLNLWLAARIAATSGRLHRPWPDLKNTYLPPMTLVALSAAIAFCFVGGLLAMLAQTVTAALLMTYAMIGFAVVHTLTLGLKARTLWLSLTYAGVVVSGGWLVVAMMILGIADTIFELRQRYLRGRPPPVPAS
jgi:hypothetical protein